MSSPRRAGRHFLVREFDCRSGAPVPVASYREVEKLVKELLDPLRDRFGRTTVLSGYRTDAHNTAVGGAARSYHKYVWSPGRGVAADVRCASGTPQDWFALLAMRGAGGLGLYDSFVHVDTRVERARWTG